MSLDNITAKSNRSRPARDADLPDDEFGRFCAKLTFVQNTVLDTPCAVWTGSKDAKGYGLVGLGGRCRRAHRVAYGWYMGEPVPADKQIHHIEGCIGPACVNVQHLQAVSAAEHFQIHAKAVCCNGHARTPENIVVYGNPDGYPRRACRSCRRETARRLYERRRQARAAQERRTA